MIQAIEESQWGHHRAPTIIIPDKWDKRNIHPPYQQNVDPTHRGTKKLYHLFSFRIKTNTCTSNISTFKSWFTHETLTYKQTGNPCTNVHGHQQSISDINNQHLELDKGILIANTLKGKLNSQQSTNASWIVTTIKSTLKIPIQKFGKPIFSFKRTHEAEVRNSKIMVAFKGDSGVAIATHKDSPVNYGSEFHDTAALKQLFLHHEDKTKIISIIKQGSDLLVSSSIGSRW